MHKIRKIVLFFWQVLITDITKEIWAKSGVEVMADDDGILWLKEKHIKSNLGYSNLPVVANKRDSSYKKHRYELVNKPKKTNVWKLFTWKTSKETNNGS